MRRLYRHVVDVADDNFTSLAASNDFLPIWPGDDFSAKIYAARPARKNEHVSKIIVAFRGSPFVAPLDATLLVGGVISPQEARLRQLFHGPNFIRSGIQRRWLLFSFFVRITAGLG